MSIKGLRSVAMHRVLAFFALLLCALSVSAQKGNDLIKEGNKLYEKGEYGEAEVRYRKSEEEKADPFISRFNLGTSLFKQQRYDEAAAAFQQLPSITEDKQNKAAAYHNLGNTMLKMKKYQESVDAYKQSLRYNPKDEETKYNLSYARRMIQQQEQQDQNKNDKQDKNEEKQDQQQQQQSKDKQDDKKDGQQQQQQPQDQKDEKQDQQQQQPKENQLSREDAERMLDAINQDERDIRERMDQQKRGPRRNVEKDW
jgi:Ca-activated chloride channel homolog